MWGRATCSLYPIYVKKQPIRLAVFTKMRIFAVALFYGVMVAQQVLVLFVVVRIRLGQLKRRLERASVFVFQRFIAIFTIGACHIQPIKTSLLAFC